MASTFPASVDTFSTPTAGSATSSPSHATLHVNVNNAITNAQTYMGLVLISSTIIGSAVSSVTVSSAFSTTYDNYKITVNGGVGSGIVNVQLQLGSSVTGYYDAGQVVNFSGAGISGMSNNNGASFTRSSACTTTAYNANIDLYNPFLAKSTFYRGDYFLDVSQAGYTIGVHTPTTSFTAFTLTPTAATLTGGTIRVYGYRQ